MHLTYCKLSGNVFIDFLFVVPILEEWYSLKVSLIAYCGKVPPLSHTKENVVCFTRLPWFPVIQLIIFHLSLMTVTVKE